jgi:putative phage-type endonuclease
MTSAIPIGRLEPGTHEWATARARRVGGSEIAAVIGISPHESRFSLWHRKRGEIGPIEETPEMTWGKRLEPVIADRYAALHPEWVVRDCPAYVHAERDYQTAAPDRLIYPRPRARRPVALLEVKTDRLSDGWGEPGTDEVLPHYRAQCLWYLDTLDLTEADVAVLIGGSEYREYLVRYDADEARFMRAAAAEFIASIDADQRPDIDAHSATYQAVKELHPDIDDVEVEIPAEVAIAYQTACADEKAAKKNKTQASARLADAMGNARRAVCGLEQIAIRVPGTNGAPPHLRPATNRRTAA